MHKFMYKGIKIIAEVKTQSPFGYKSNEPWEDLLFIAENVGDIIAVHTDPRWGGSFKLIEKAKSFERLTDKIVLAKGIHDKDDDIVRAIEAGADYVLVVGRIPGVFPGKCWIEPYNLDELATIPKEFRVVWNARDLRTWSPKAETFESARKLWDGWLCQASYLRNVSDIMAGADGVLVGEHLREFAKSMGYAF